MYHPRLVSDHLVKLSKAFPVVVVSGARQVGKTTLLRHLFPNHDCVVFDASIDIENARQDPDLFLLNHPPPVILDEIQYAPEVVSAIKRHVDRVPDRYGAYLLTGSQQWQVMRSVSESLAGRAAFLDLNGFSIGEMSMSTEGWLGSYLSDPEGFVPGVPAYRLETSPSEWLWRGSLPRATQLDASLIPDFWMAYHRTYIERDARLLTNVADWQDFTRFVRLMCTLTAQEINASQLGREIGITPQTARRWLQVLIDTFQWFEIPAWSGNPGKRVSLKPKGYISDTGLACHHAFISSPAGLSGHPLFGALFETGIAGELIKQAGALATKPAFHHWRSAGGAEVDLILEFDGRLYPIEIKLTTQPTRKQVSGIHAFRAAHPNHRIAKGLLICAVSRPYLLSEHVLAMPFG
jgi:uncharacterized protein